MKRCLVVFSREYKLIIEGVDPWDAVNRATRMTQEEIERYCEPIVHYHAAVVVPDNLPGFKTRGEDKL